MAEYFEARTPADIPPDVRRPARVCLLNTLGVILSGHAHLVSEEDTRLMRYLATMEGAGQATALECHRRYPPPTAATAHAIFGQNSRD